MSERQRAELEQLFEKIPELEYVYYFRWGVTEVFDKSASREEAAAALEAFRDTLGEDDEELLEFFSTYDEHKDGILAYFDSRKTSGPVEGINNKARVITKRCYGIRQVKTLWNRLCLDLNLAAKATGQTVAQLSALIKRIRSKFLGYYT